VTKPLRALGELSATCTGWALGGAFFLLGKARGRKALHPRGEVFHGLIDRHGSVGRTGVPWLDEAGTDDVAVRFSRSLGLPAPHPDILGLALRVPVMPGQFGDVLLATTGTGFLGRYTCLFVAVSVPNHGWRPPAGSNSHCGQPWPFRIGLLRAQGTVALIRDTGGHRGGIPGS
jgi:hypothetical protein